MKRITLLAGMLVFALGMFAQAVQPSLMVFPNDAWCKRNGFMKTVTKENGKEKYIPEYDKALMDNPDILPSIHTIGAMMQERGFQLIDLQANLKAQDLEDALDNADEEGMDISEYDRILASAGPDIAMHINYWVEEQGPRVTIFYELTALDAYTSKQVASTGVVSHGPVMKAPLQNLIQTALLGSIDKFNAQLMQHFNDMREKGREISIKINVRNGWEDGLDTEVEDKELTEIIEDWVAANTVAGRSHQKSASSTSMVYDSARIPLFDAKGRAIQAKNWLKGLQKDLKKMGVPSKIKTRGLGQAQLIIGE